MEEWRKKIIKAAITVLLASGLIYAYYNVLNTRFENVETKKRMKEITKEILEYPNTSSRMECRSFVYIIPHEENQEPVQDGAMAVQFVHDLEHGRLQIVQGARKEIFEFQGENVTVFSQGTTALYRSNDVYLDHLSEKQWYHYPCKPMYGVEWRNGRHEQLSYGYLSSMNDLVKIQDNGIVESEEETVRQYTVHVKNTLHEWESQEESDKAFRKILNSHGLDVIELKKNYQEAYKLLRKIYNQATEEMLIWVDEEGRMIKIEKDYTFYYYLDILKENSEIIREKIEKYDYPRVMSVQMYSYSPECSSIDLPEKFEEL